MSENVRDLTTTELRERAQGCTEATCIYHGTYNIEIHRRGER